MAREHVTERAVVDHIGPSEVLLDDLTGVVEIRALILDLLQTSWIPLDHGLGARFATLEFGAVRDAVAHLARALPNVGGRLTKHAEYLPRGLD
eukprot:1112138-Prymnesium_polylepis.1